MTIGLVGRKVGMTRIFTDEGDTLPVTVLDVSDNRITQIKSPDKDGYSAVQVTFGKRRACRVGKPLAGHLAKAGVEAGHILKEFRAKPEEVASLKVGGKMASHRLGDAARAAFAERHLNGGIAVAFRRLDLRNPVVGHVEHRHRRGIAVVSEDARHADLAADKSYRHAFLFSLTRKLPPGRRLQLAGFQCLRCY